MKVQKGMCWERRRKLVQGNVVDEQFEFVDIDRMKIVTLETVPTECQTHKCDKDCFFRKKNSIADDAESKSIKMASSGSFSSYERNVANRSTRWSRHNSMYVYKVRPCYMHACDYSTPKKRRITKGEECYVNYSGQVYYRFISEKDIDQES